MQGPGHVQNANLSHSAIMSMPNTLLAFNALSLLWLQKELIWSLCRSVVRFLPSSSRRSGTGQHLWIIAKYALQEAGRVHQSCWKH